MAAQTGLTRGVSALTSRIWRDGYMKATVLFLAADPFSEETKLELEKEYKAVYNALAGAQHGDAFPIGYYPDPATFDFIRLLLDSRPAILHFSGHGSPHDELIFVSEDGEAQAASTDALRTVFGALDEPARLVVLNACYSESQAKAITETVDFAIGMSSEITDEAAIVFSTEFYRALGENSSVAAAHGLGLAVLKMEQIPEAHIPRLICRRGADPRKAFIAMEYSEAAAGSEDADASKIVIGDIEVALNIPAGASSSGEAGTAAEGKFSLQVGDRIARGAKLGTVVGVAISPYGHPEVLFTADEDPGTIHQASMSLFSKLIVEPPH